MALRELRLLRCLLIGLAASILVCAPALAATFTVNSTADSSDASPGDAICDAGGGVCTLRAAIEEANANFGPDAIHFAIGTGPQTISPASPLPDISQTVTIDGTTQPGYAGTPLIELDGIGAGSGHGLFLPAIAGGSTIRALLVNRFPGNGIALGGNGNTVESCHIGTDATKTQNRGNGDHGIAVYEGDNNLIRFNVLAFNGNSGVAVFDGEVYPFPLFTALTPDHTAVFPSIDFTDGCSNFRHSAGGTIVDTSGRAFNEHFGMRLTATMSIPMSGSYNFAFTELDDYGRLVIDSVEELSITGPGPNNVNVNLSAGDHSFEVGFWEGAGSARLLMTINGPGTPTFNFSGNPGLQGELFQSRVAAEGNRISQNSTFDNFAQGIALSCCCRDVNDAGDIDAGPNTFLNYPVFTNRFFNPNGTITVEGTAPIGSYVEVFGSTNDTSGPFSGYGEGKLYLATSAIVGGSGTFIATFTLPSQYYSVTATSTDASGNTSEFSQNFAVRPREVQVTNTNDDGPGSLRAAILDANTDGVETLISFHPSLSGASITLNSSLPNLTENGTTINGDINGDCKPDIELRGDGGAQSGVTLQSSGNTIRGLALNRFGTAAIVFEGPPASNNQLVCNFLGTTLAGTASINGGLHGIVVNNGASNNQIGTVDGRNVIGLFGANGIWISNSPNNVIAGNVIGLDVTGTLPIPALIGVQITNANGTFIGTAGAGNRIVGTNGGIDVSGGASHRIYGNTIGWPTGSTPSAGYGIRFSGGANNATVGGTAPGEANRIENNGGSGIHLDGTNVDSINIRANAISGNGGLGIDLDGNGVTPNDGADGDISANEGQNFPVLTRATTTGATTTVDGFLDSPVVGGNYVINFYASTARDPSGYGEGATHLFTFLTQPGAFSTALPAVPAGAWITATATANLAGNTSEFSLAIQAAGPPLGATELVAFPILPTSVELRWRDPQTSETGFRIERMPVGGSFGLLTNVGPDTTSFVDTTVPPGTQVWYRLIATSAGGDAPASNIATARAFHTITQQTCRTQVNATHSQARASSVAWNGTNWAIAWEDMRNGRASDIYFQFLDAATGAPIGSPMQITNDDVPSRFPSLTWNGTHYGLLWYDHVRQPNGDVKSRLSFALLGPTGSKVRGDVKVISNATAASLNLDGTTALVWDGSGWGVFLQEATASPSDIVFYRLDPDGDVVVNGVALTTTPALEGEISATWNGTEYGIVWAEQNGTTSSSIKFQRMQANGTVIPPQRNLFSSPQISFGTNVIWDGTGWAVAWTDISTSGDRIVQLTRLAGDGSSLGPVVRLSDASPVLDQFPKLFVKPGGGYVVFTESVAPSGAAEVGRLEADAGGARVGSRTLVSPDDGFDSHFPRAAASGTDFLLSWEETRLNPIEVGSAVVSAAGVPGAANDVTTTHTPPAFATQPAVLAMLNQFVTLWNARYQGASQLHAKILRSDGSFVDKRPLNAANSLRRPAAVAYGGHFAVAWVDAGNGEVRLERFDNNGNSQFAGGVLVASAVSSGRGVGLAYSGEVFGLVFSQGGFLKFQRMSDTAPIGTATSISSNPQNDPQVQWTGNGWAVVWRSSSNLFFARLDPAGALVIPPTQVTDTFANPSSFELLWNGQHLGLAWAENHSGINPASDIYFTVLDANGFKTFAPVTVASTQFADRSPTLIWDGTNFRVLYPDYAMGIRDIGVSATGVVLPSPRFHGNHGEGQIHAAFNGATLGMAWAHLSDVLFQTTACLADTSPPACVTLNGSYGSGAVQLNWPAANDPQSGLLAYHLYRDGKLLTELLPSTTTYTDGGFTPGAVHSYELRPFNGAYLEATGCTPKAITAGIEVLPASLPNGRQTVSYLQSFTAPQGTGNSVFTVTAGALPPGLGLGGPGNRNLSGSPTTVGVYNFTITATDTVGATGSRAYALRICPNTTVVPTVLPDPVVNSSYSQAITLRGTSDPFTAAITSGALPAGLTLAANGTLSGTPTVTGAFTFTLTVTESTSCATSQAYSFTVLSGKAPRNVRALGQSSSSILVQWDLPQHGESGFRIERSLDAITWGAINNVGSDVTSHLDSGLGAATLYYYRVVAFSGAQDSATSHVTAGTTFPLGPTKICQQAIGPYHSRAQAISLAHTGTQWAAVWQDRRDGLAEELYFQFLDNGTGAPLAAPLRITTTDMLTRFPMLRWNGSQFGVLYTENLRGPSGEITSTTNFALLDAAGAVLRSGVRVLNTTNGALNGGLDLPFVWDGGGWGVFASESRGNPPADLYYWRLSPSGDVVTGPVRLTTGIGWEQDISAAWNGTEYGLAWIERDDAGANRAVRFQRMQVDGTLIGAPIAVEAMGPNLVFVPNVAWNTAAGEWAVAWMHQSTETIVKLRLLNPDGSPKGAAVRISDDPSVNPSQPIDDEVPLVYPKAGGGYHVFTESFQYTTSNFDVARLQTDAAGNRVGSRVYLTAADLAGTSLLRASTDGTRFMLGYDDISASQMEAMNLIVDAAGTLTHGPTAVTTGHGGGNSVTPVLVPLGAGFAAVWNETGGSGQLRAKLYDGGGNLTSTKTPLSPSTGVRSRVSAVGVGNTFAVAWRDTTSLRFGRFDSAGNPLITETVLPTGGNQPGLGWNGEHYGLAFYEGNSLRFQKINADGTLNGPKIAVADGTGAVAPQMLWTGSGWAIVWRLNPDLYFTLLDRNGAYLVPPIRVTFTATNENNPSIAWSGDQLGLLWNEARTTDPPGNDIWFTALNLDGTKAFAEKNLVSTPYSDGLASIYWAGDRFRIVHGYGSGGVRELAVQADGTVIPGHRVFHNRTLPMSLAFNGVTLGMLFSLDDLTLQTSACFDDVSAPACPTLATNFNGQRVRLTWPSVSDPESGIGAYNLYRDGAQLAELSSTATLFDDFGFLSGATHLYEVRAVNRAYLESSGCTLRTVVAGINVTPATLANGNVGSNFNSTFIAQQGTGPYTFAVTAGALPPGLALGGPGNHNLTGNPTTAGLYNFTITATDSLGATGSRAYTLRICAGISLFPTVLADGYLSTAYSQTIVTAGAVGAVTLSITAGALPAGLTMDATGWVNGMPTATGTFNVTIAAADSLGCTASRAYGIVVGTGAAVRNLSAFALSTSTIRLRWRDPQRNETGFRLERSTDLGASWAPFTIVGGDVTTYTDSGLTAGTTYSYRVIATTPGGDAPASNIGTAATFPATAAKACIQQVSPSHSFARFPSPVYTGTQWAMAYSENDEIYFTFLNSAGAPVGTPVRMTTNDTIPSRSTLRWNGTHFGLMWFESLKGSAGEPINGLRFALIDAAGNVVRRDVRVPLPDAVGSGSSEINFLWDGSGWGLVEARATTGGFFDLFFLRLDLDGDLTAGPFQLTSHADFDGQASLAWNGTEYGLSWMRFGGNTTFTLLFQRLSAAGALLGSPTVLTSSTTTNPNFPDVVATPGGGWAVAWSESPDDASLAVFLRRLDAAGAPLEEATRLSDDFDLNGFTPAQMRPVTDNFQDLWALPGGGFVVFTRSNLNATFRQEVGFLRADATGNRIGPRTILSTQDLFHSGFTRVAFDGTNFLAAYNEHRLGTQEMASVIVSQSGAIVTGPTDISSGHGPGNNIGITSSSQAQLAVVGGGFAALWSEPFSATENRVYAKLFDGSGNVTATRSPLLASSARGRPGAIGVGSTFATAWKDTPNNIVFARWDAAGNPLITPVNVATSAGGSAGVSVGFDGEHYGLLWNQGGRLSFQRVNAAGGSIGARSTLATSIVNTNQQQQMVWTGSGWAIVFITDNDVYYALLDINGAVAVPPIRVTFTPSESKEGMAISWSGDVVGIAFANRPPVDPPGLVVNFTTVDLQGIKQFTERSVSEGRLDNTLQGLNWDVDHFRIAFVPGESGTLREIDISPTGTLLGPSRMLTNRGGFASVLWNGATAGVLWGQLTELYFETTACLADATPPTCPTVSATRSSGPVTLSWTPATDAESGIYRYVIYRDGIYIGEAFGRSYFDAGVRAADQHTYRVVGVNGAYLESVGCATVVPVAAPASLVATATSPTNVNLTWIAAAGATSYTVERSSNGTTYVTVGTAPSTAYADATVLSARSYLYRVIATIGTSTSAPSNVDLATTVLFTDDPLVAGVTVVKAIHLTEMRTAVNALRTTLAALPAATWTDSATPGTLTRAIHITELRTAVNQARTAVALPPLTFTDTLSPGSLLKAVHSQEVRNGVK